MSEPVAAPPATVPVRQDRAVRVRPGYLVNLTTRLVGGVEYTREELERDLAGATEHTAWRTDKVVADKDEHAQAVAVRGRVRSIIRSACVWTPFGMICPVEVREPEPWPDGRPGSKTPTLDLRIAEARALADSFNAAARHSRVTFSTLRGEIAENAADAVRAVREEVAALLGELRQAVAVGDVASIRDVAQKATQMGRLVEEGTAARTALERAVKEARRVRSELVKRVGEGAEAVAEVLAGAQVSVIATAMMTFTEEEQGEITDGAGETMPQVELAQFADLEEAYVPPPEPDAAAEVEAEPETATADDPDDEPDEPTADDEPAPGYDQDEIV